MAKSRQHSMSLQIRAHARLLFSIAVGIVAFILVPLPNIVTRGLLAWDIAVWLFLALALKMMLSASMADLKKRAGLEDEGRVATLLIVIAATLAAFIALSVELANAQNASGAEKGWRAALALSAIVGSWLFMNVAFALHYAHEVYHTRQSISCLSFPNEKEPDYWDFMYFAMVLGTTFQTSDVEIRSRALRRTAMLQGLVAFFFNTAIIALSVSIASQLLGGK